MQAALDRHIQTSPAVRGGKPCLAGTRIAVSDVALMHLRLGQSLEEITGRYDLALAAVHAAMAYYYDHRDEIDRLIDEQDAYVQATWANNPSLLREKLKAPNGG